MKHFQTQETSSLGFLTSGLGARETVSRVFNPLGQALFISQHVNSDMFSNISKDHFFVRPNDLMGRPSPYLAYRKAGL